MDNFLYDLKRLASTFENTSVYIETWNKF